MITTDNFFVSLFAVFLLFVLIHIFMKGASDIGNKLGFSKLIMYFVMKIKSFFLR